MTPIIIKKGADFSYTLEIPASIVGNRLTQTHPTAQLRRDRSNLPSDLIAELATRWVDPATGRKLEVSHQSTWDWPVGLAEFDVLFTTMDGRTEYSTTVKVDIQPGITGRDKFFAPPR